ncbi:MAG: hypothetical protein LV479_10715 [Methylacidiphilales bacterium]|nr:hypothetical protein [Candidatus Methylacidiphilales bacterium]
MKAVLFICSFLAILTFSLYGQVPQLINYQGRIVTGTTNFNGSGQFKFALVNSNGSVTYWSNDGTSTAGSQPNSAVTLNVINGLYAVLLGDTTLPHMTTLGSSVFNNTDVRLRIWFNDGTNGFQLLSPDQRLAAAGYALVSGTAQNVPTAVVQASLSGGSGTLDLSQYNLNLAATQIPNNNANTTGSAGSVNLAGMTGLGTGVASALGNATNSTSGVATYAAGNQVGMTQGLVPAASGNSALSTLRHSYAALNNLAALKPGAYFTWLMTGDSVAGFLPSYIISTLQNQYGIAGWGPSWGVGITGVTANTGDFVHWPSGNTYTFDSGHVNGVCGYAPYGTVQLYVCDTFKFYFLTTTGTAGTNTFKIQSSTDGTNWTDVTNTKLAINVTQTTIGTTTTGNTACDTDYTSVVGGVATVKMSSVGKYMFRVVRLTGSFTAVGCQVINSSTSGVIAANLAQGGIDVGEMSQTPAAILNPIMYEINPTLVSFEVKDSVAIFNQYLSKWQSLIGTACLNADFVDMACTPSINAAPGDELGQATILKTNATALGHFFFDGYGLFGSYRDMATLGPNSTVSNNPLAATGTTLTIPADALSSFLTTNFTNGGYIILAIWDAGTDPLTNNDFEYVAVSGGTAPNFTISRGLDGTAAIVHPQGSNVAAGWTLDGVHPTAACNEYMAGLLYQQLGFGALASNPDNLIGQDPNSVGSSTYETGVSLNLGSGANTDELVLNGSSNADKRIYALDANNQFNYPLAYIQFDPDHSLVGFQNFFDMEIMLAPDQIQLGYLSNVTPDSSQVFIGNNLNSDALTIRNVNTVDFLYLENSSGAKLAQVQADGTVLSASNIVSDTVGKGFQVKEGTNAKQGVATLSSGTATIANTNVTANSRIYLTAQDGNTTGALRISTRTPGTSFTITSSNSSDSGVVAWEIFEPAP